MIVDEWQGCYPSNWRGVLSKDSISHPAKYSSRLIERIYQHAFEEGWLTEGARVVDCFAGVASGAWPALRLGLDWVGVELEPRFAELGQGNIQAWNAHYAGKLPRWGQAQLINGDSRKLVEHCKAASSALALSSPPYAASLQVSQSGGGIDPSKSQYHGGPNSQMNRPDTRYGSSEGQLGALKEGDFNAAIASPPFLQAQGGTHVTSTEGPLSDPRLIRRHSAGNQAANAYGESEGQISSLPEGNFDAAISSPPFTDSLSRDTVDAEARRAWAREHGIANAEHVTAIDMERAGKRDQRYGDTPGQLGGMPSNDFNAAISSPPFENQTADGGWQMFDRYAQEGRLTIKQAGGDPTRTFPSWSQERDTSYGNAEGQLGQEHGETFWTASRQIVEQVYQVLAPGGVAIWVVKSYIKNHQMVDFPGQWRQLCEAVGFDALHEHHAMLVNHRGTYQTLEGEVIEDKVSSKSFFRRLAERKGSPAIDFETVLCMRKA